MATQPGILGALTASVTDLQIVTCIMCFLKVRVYSNAAAAEPSSGGATWTMADTRLMKYGTMPPRWGLMSVGRRLAINRSLRWSYPNANCHYSRTLYTLGRMRTRPSHSMNAIAMARRRGLVFRHLCSAFSAPLRLSAAASRGGKQGCLTSSK